MAIDKKRLERVTNSAEYEFWKTVSKHYPEIKSGDVDPWAAIQFTTRLKEEIEKNEKKPDKGLYNPDAGHIEDE